VCFETLCSHGKIPTSPERFGKDFTVEMKEELTKECLYMDEIFYGLTREKFM
jgi:hypothetical protein